PAAPGNVIVLGLTLARRSVVEIRAKLLHGPSTTTSETPSACSHPVRRSPRGNANNQTTAVTGSIAPNRTTAGRATRCLGFHCPKQERLWQKAIGSAIMKGRNPNRMQPETDVVKLRETMERLYQRQTDIIAVLRRGLPLLRREFLDPRSGWIKRVKKSPRTGESNATCTAFAIYYLTDGGLISPDATAK